MFIRYLLAASLAVLLGSSTTLAAPIPINSVACTGYFNETEAFPCTNAIDGRTNDMDGSVNDWSFWLGRSYQANEALVFDLGLSQVMLGFTVYNTHNRQHNDRGTQDFRIYVSSLAPTPGNEATYGLLVVDDKLVFYTDNPNPPQPFSLDIPVSGQFVTFVTDSLSPGLANGLGISEFEVLGVPEPSTWVLAAGLAVLALLRRGRLNAKT